MTRNARRISVPNPGWGLIVLAVSISFCAAAQQTSPAAAKPQPPPLSKARITAAVEAAKAGQLDRITNTTDAIARKDVSVPPELLADAIACFKDENRKVQLLGVRMLYELRDPASRQPLADYLKAKDFKKLREAAEAETVDRVQLFDDYMVSLFAIMTLGKVGTKEDVPLLESLKDFDFHLEWGGDAVAEALVDLGAVGNVLNTPKDADSKTINKAVDGVLSIRDPSQAPSLMAAARDEACADEVRCAALQALGKIKTPDVPPFLVSVIDDDTFPPRLRQRAIMVVAQNKLEEAEPVLLSHARGREFRIRSGSVIGLAILKPSAYLDMWFEQVMDPKEGVLYRGLLSCGWKQIPRDVLKERKEQLYQGLSASTEDGTPIDRVRASFWLCIHELFGEQPQVVLTTRSEKFVNTKWGSFSNGVGDIERVLLEKEQRENSMKTPPVSYREEKEEVQRQMEALIQVHGTGKEDVRQQMELILKEYGMYETDEEGIQ